MSKASGTVVASTTGGDIVAAEVALGMGALSIPDVRDRLGHLWGLERPLTRAELARALDLSPKHGGSHISKLEAGKTTLSGPIEVAIRMMMNGAVPHTMEGVVKPGYPRGGVR